MAEGGRRRNWYSWYAHGSSKERPWHYGHNVYTPIMIINSTEKKDVDFLQLGRTPERTT